MEKGIRVPLKVGYCHTMSLNTNILKIVSNGENKVLPVGNHWIRGETLLVNLGFDKFGVLPLPDYGKYKYKKTFTSERLAETCTSCAYRKECIPNAIEAGLLPDVKTDKRLEDSFKAFLKLSGYGSVIQTFSNLLDPLHCKEARKMLLSMKHDHANIATFRRLFVFVEARGSVYDVRRGKIC